MGLKFSGGSLNVSPRSGTSGSIDDLYDVIISNPVENDILTYDATVPAWKNVSLIAGNGLNQSFFQLDKTLSVVAAPAGGIVVNATGVAVDNTVLRSTSANLTVTNLTVTGTLTANNAANTVNATFLDGQNSSFYRNATNINAGTLDAARLPISGVTAGVYGSGSNIPVLTVDNKGRITSASTVALATSSETVSGAVRLATGAETNNATSAILAVNPLNLGIFYAKKASPAFTGTPTTVTPSVGNNTTQIANTAFVASAISTALSGYVPNTGDTTKIGKLTISKVIGTAGSYTNSQLEISSGDAIGDAVIGFHRPGATACALKHEGNGLVLTGSSDAAPANFVATGDVGAYSDIRLKTNIKTITDALHKVSQLTGVVYDRIESGERQTGLIAQDVQKVLPEAVIEGNDENKTLAIVYGNLAGLLVEAIKELKEESKRQAIIIAEQARIIDQLTKGLK
jgi:hypothetical protein